MTKPLLDIRDLSVSFDVDGTQQVAVVDVDLQIAHDEVLAVVGESGSGKSVTAMSLFGLLPGNATVAGSALLDGVDLYAVSEAERRRIVGSKIAMIFQDPMAALNPLLTVGYQLGESVRLQNPDFTRSEVRARSVQLLETVEIVDPEAKLGHYPHQLSGGQCQRIVIAMALAGEPALLVADEPTTALDVTVQAEILDVLRRMRARLRSSILLITHDMGVVADVADTVTVMRNGRVVENAPVERLFRAPQDSYTRELLAAVPQIGRRRAERSEAHAPAPSPVLEIENLVVEYRQRHKRVRAVDDLSLTLNAGEIMAVVGESGSGKSTTAMASIGLAPITGGTVRVLGRSLADARGKERKRLQERIGVVFQNPAMSLNPRFSIHEAVGEPLRVHRRVRGTELRDRVDNLLEAVGLPGRWGERYPHELSGGQRQRVAIARAVALEPELLIADEPTSALDVSVQARVLDVFRELQSRLGFACLFITHDLAVVDTLSDSVAVMQHGKLVELGERATVFESPRSDYTRELLDAAPIPDPAIQRDRRARRAG